ncbi:MAG: MBOAT family O-acyltransferase [Gammaproteobacteria bacterium]
MLFHSPGFLLLFLPLSLLLLRFMPVGTARALTLLALSYLFYSGAEPWFVLLLIASTLTDYAVALRIQADTRRTPRGLWLALSVVVNIGLLAWFKLGGWLLPSIAPVLAGLGLWMPDPDVFDGYLLPAGISFYTFQSLAYSIDVYRGRITATRDLLGFANYVAYFPQLIAGPIERHAHLAPQLDALTSGHTRGAEARPPFSAGWDRLMLGIAQKLLLADSFGRIVDRLVDAPGPPDLFAAWSIALGFGLQIYFDFAAYTHMAIGISLMLGVRLRENFLSPYQAESIRDFWRRWHVSLSSWFRDYLYIPLGGSQSGPVRTVFNVLVVFALCGLWHGAGANFVLWGVLHGLLLAAYHARLRWLPDLSPPRALAMVLTFLCVHWIWVPFRIADSARMVSVWQGMAGLNGIDAQVPPLDLLFLTLGVVGVLFVPHAARRWPGAAGAWESGALTTLALVAVFSTPASLQFIYFQF